MKAATHLAHKSLLVIKNEKQQFSGKWNLQTENILINRTMIIN